MPNPGKLVIGTIVTVALAAAGSAWWYTYRSRSADLDTLGPRDGLSNPAGAGLRAAGTRAGLASRAHPIWWSTRSRWKIRQRVDLSQARGFVHARQALIEDSSYRWEVPAVTSEPADLGVRDPVSRRARGDAAGV